MRVPTAAGKSMTEYRFENVRLVLGESNPNIRSSLKSSLFGEGFRDVIDTSDLDMVRHAMERGDCDVLMCDVAMPGGDFCDMVHAARHHRLGPNPFLIVIALTAVTDRDLIRRIVDAGVDDIVLKPFSVDMLLGRLKMLARGRKPFVVTHDYIGPDRRRQARPDSPQSTPLIDVPNVLHSKAVANTDPATLQRMIDEAAARINEEKSERHVVQVDWLVERILAAYQDAGADRSATGEQLQRLARVGEDLALRLRSTAFAHVAEMALSLKGVAERILDNINSPHPRDLELLAKISQTFDRLYSRDKKTVETAMKISERVIDYTRRQN